MHINARQGNKTGRLLSNIIHRIINSKQFLRSVLLGLTLLISCTCLVALQLWYGFYGFRNLFQTKM